MAYRALARHVAVLAVAVLFVNLGVWQLRRLEERRRQNALLEAGSRMPAVSPADAAPYRRVSVSGSYDAGHEVVLVGRAFEGRAGHHLLTPLLTGDGRAVIVDRGWVPFDRPRAAPVAGRVLVTGIALESEGQARFFGPRRVSRVDVAALGARLPYRVHPLYLLLSSQDPPQRMPVPQEVRRLDEGRHLSYAVQWFVFALGGLVGYVVLLRRKRGVRADRL